MSIDFDILKWSGARERKFPVEYGDAPDETAPLPWLEIKAYLFGLGARENGSEDCLWLDLQDEGTLQFRGTRDTGNPQYYVWIGIKVHAYWTQVLAIYRKALTLDPDLVLFDPQEGVFHNASTFEPLALAQKQFQEGTEEV